MRTLPTKEQIDYLISVGIEPKRLPMPATLPRRRIRGRRKAVLSPSLAPEPQSQQSSIGIRPPIFEKIQGWFRSLFKAWKRHIDTLIIIIFFEGWLFLGTSTVLSAAEPSDAFGNVQLTLHETLDLPQYEPDSLSMRIGLLELSIYQEHQRLQGCIASLNQFSNTFFGVKAEATKTGEVRYQRLCAALNNLRIDTEQTKNAFRSLESEFNAVNCANAIKETRHESRFIAWIAGIAITFLSLLVIGFLLTRREVKRLVVANRRDSSQIHQETSGCKSIPATPHELSLNDSDILPPDIQLQNLIQSASVDSSLQIKPQPAEPWAVACATIKGHVRVDNQDYGLCFSVGPYHVLLLADGCGGLPHGAKASYLAVVAAASSIIRSIGTTADIDTLMVARQALNDASNKLATRDAYSGNDGLRTTLIIVIASDNKYAFAYIGDGGGVIVHKSGNAEKFLFAQKAMEDMANVLAASLGPDMEGTPALGCIPCYPGDLLICGTDGVFDYAGKSFPIAVAQKVAAYDGNLQKAADTVLNDLADYKDQFGPVCSDNLTLGLVADSVRRAMSIGDCQPLPDKAASQQQALKDEEVAHD